MKIRHIALGLAAALGIAFSAHAELSATCKDGTNWSGEHRQGACARHGGVKEWTAAEPAGAARPSMVPSASAPAAPAPTTAPATTSTTTAPSRAGQVWVNTATHVYHCPGDRWYGKTKRGEYMSEEQARAARNRPDHYKACS